MAEDYYAKICVPIVLDDKLIKLFWERVNRPSDPDECWIWIGGKASDGYGVIHRISASGRKLFIRAHRISWTIHNGEIPSGLVICHKCDRRICVNPVHMFLGTQSDNLNDARKKERLKQKEVPDFVIKRIPLLLELGFTQAQIADFFGIPASTLSKAKAREFGRRIRNVSDENVLEIYERANQGESTTMLAKEYGIAADTVRSIKRGQDIRCANNPDFQDRINVEKEKK